MQNDELEIYIEECNCREIQDKAKWEGSIQVCVQCHKEITYMIFCDCETGKASIKLPTIDQLLKILGDRFISLSKEFTGSNPRCKFYKQLRDYATDFCDGQSYRIALIRAVKKECYEEKYRGQHPHGFEQ